MTNLSYKYKYNFISYLKYIEKYFPILFLLYSIITISRIVCYSSYIIENLFKFNIASPALIFGFISVSLLINIFTIGISANLTYFCISILNIKLQEIENYEETKVNLKRYCYISYILPFILNSIFLIIYFLITKSYSISVNFNSIIVNLLISFILWLSLKYIIKTRKTCIIIAIITFIVNSSFIFIK